jgi:thymidine phosphorylase
MSAFLNGMDDEETFLLTDAMINSGVKLDLSFLDLPTADKLTGAARDRKEDKIDYSAGVVFYKKLNDYVEKGEVIAKLVYNSSEHIIDEAETLMSDAYIHI